jgi:hypothetical protein
VVKQTGIGQMKSSHGASHKGREMDKQIVKEAMLSLEACDLEGARAK